MKALRTCALSLLALGIGAVGSAAGPLQFYSVNPCRLVDTRGPTGPSGGPVLSSGAQRNFPILGLCGIPGTAKAVAVNAAVVAPTDYGFLVMWANGATMPSVSNINFNPAEFALANGAIVKLTYPPNEFVNPTLQLAASAYVAASGTVHFVLDVVGYYE